MMWCGYSDALVDSEVASYVDDGESVWRAIARWIVIVAAAEHDEGMKHVDMACMRCQGAVRGIGGVFSDGRWRVHRLLTAGMECG